MPDLSSPNLDRREGRYRPLAIFLHWMIAALIIITWLLPHSRGLLPHSMKGTILSVHRSIGMTIFALVVLRAVSRLISAPPALPPGTLQLLRWLSHAGHAALYLLMLAVPLFGMALTWSGGHELSFWGLVHIPEPIDFTGDKGVFSELHWLAANGLLWLAGLHAAAALVHQYVFRDGLLDRMLPASLRSARADKIAI